MKINHTIAMCGALVLLAGCNQGDNTKSDSSASAVTNEMRDAAKGVPAPPMTNAPSTTPTNQETPPAPK